MKVEEWMQAENEKNSLLGSEPSAHTKAEEALRDSQSRLAGIVDSAMDAIITIDSNQRIILFNAAAEKMFRIHASDALGQAIDRFIPERYRAAHREYVRAFGQAGVTRRAMAGARTIKGLRADAEEFPVEASISQVEAGGQKLYTVIMRDVTEREQAEEERLRLLAREQEARAQAEASERHYRELADAMPQIVWTARPDGYLDYYNQRWFDYTGLTLEQTKGWGWQLVLHPDDLQKCLERWSEAVRTGQRYEIEYRFKRAADGRYRWHLGRAFPIRDAEGRITKWYGTCTDIHDQKRAEDELQKVREELEQRVERRTGDLSRVNTALREEIFERARVEAQRQVIFDIIQGITTTANLNELLQLIHRALSKVLYADNCYVALYDRNTGLFSTPFIVDQVDKVAAPPQKLRRGCTAYVFRKSRPVLLTDESFRRLTEEGEIELVGTPPAVWMGVPLRTPTETIGVLAIQHYENRNAYSERDLEFLASVGDQITISIERKRTEELKGHFISMLEATTDLVCMMNMQGRLIYMNRAGRRMLGITEDEDVTQLTINSIHPEWGQKLFAEEAIPTALREGVWTGETAFMSRDGREIPTSKVMLSHKDAEGNVRMLSTIARDITERKKIEAELKKARDAALESARLKSNFLANMSHEIRTPMNGVIGMTSLLLETDLSSQQREYAEAIETSADSLLNIIDDILDFSKIEAGKLRFEKISFDLRNPVEGPVELLAERAHTKGIELASVIEQNVPKLLRGDPGRLRQVLTNLIGNAIKFTEHGEVILSVRKERETAQHVIIRFEVSDTGIGIAPHAQRSLFQAFIQADSSMTRKYGGTGLGLAISKQLVELMGGEIGVKSELGKGSTFWFTARFEKQHKEKVMPRPRQSDLSGVRVLIVYDSAPNRKILLQQTTSWGMRTTEAESGLQALQLLRDAASKGEPFEIAILDLMMPGMDGFDLARTIKTDSAIAQTRLVLLPSHSQRGHGEMAREAGISCYLPKPVRQSQLYNILTEVMAEPMDAQSARLITKYSLKEAGAREDREFSNARILVAEDNAVNQKVALSQLHNLGYAADAVTNGREVLKALEETPYDVILMDCQMPEVDGYEATAEIRRRQCNAKRTTIIAMTAHALEGEREKCLAAGMDDYLSKPVKSEALHQVLKRWIKAPVALEHSAESKATKDSFSSTGEAFDMNVLGNYREIEEAGQPGLVSELIALFIDSTEKHLAALDKAAAEENACAIKESAHSIKGASANIGAHQIASISAELEGKAERRGEAENLIARLRQELERVRHVLEVERQRRSIK
jgi:PAS domain S-box-containing protein